MPIESRTFDVHAITDIMSAKFKCQVKKTEDFMADYGVVWDNVLDLMLKDEIKGNQLLYCDIKEAMVSPV